MVQLLGAAATAADYVFWWLVQVLLVTHAGILAGAALAASVGIRVAERASVDIGRKDRVLLGTAGAGWGAATASGTFAFATRSPDWSFAWYDVSLFGMALGLVEGALLGPLVVSFMALWREALAERAVRSRRTGQTSR